MTQPVQTSESTRDLTGEHDVFSVRKFAPSQ